jgi:hypothetical protein
MIVIQDRLLNQKCSFKVSLGFIVHLEAQIKVTSITHDSCCVQEIHVIIPSGWPRQISTFQELPGGFHLKFTGSNFVEAHSKTVVPFLTLALHIFGSFEGLLGLLKLSIGKELDTKFVPRKSNFKMMYPKCRLLEQIASRKRTITASVWPARTFTTARLCAVIPAKYLLLHCRGGIDVSLLH